MLTHKYSDLCIDITIPAICAFLGKNDLPLDYQMLIKYGKANSIAN